MQTKEALIIALAIILGAIIHAGFTRPHRPELEKLKPVSPEIGRYQFEHFSNGVNRYDTVTGNVYDIDGKLFKDKVIKLEGN